MPLNPDFWTTTFSDIAASVLLWLPRLGGALLWLILGWFVARVVQFVLDGLLRRLGLDRLAERAGASRVLADAGLDPSSSRLLARFVYWIVLLVFVLAAAESLGLSGVVDTLEGFIGYLPSVLAAALILLLGGLIARLVGDTVGALASQAGVAAGPTLGQTVRYVLLVVVGILTLEQLGLETTLLITLATALIGATALALSLAFGLGSRDVARNIMAGFHAKDAFSPGQHLHVRGHAGRLESIGAVKAVLETPSGRVSLPNFALTDEEVLIVDPGQDSP